MTLFCGYLLKHLVQFDFYYENIYINLTEYCKKLMFSISEKKSIRQKASKVI